MTEPARHAILSSMIILMLVGITLETVSMPGACLSRANPALVGSYADYELYAIPDRIGSLSYLHGSIRHNQWGLGLSAASQHERGQAWLSISRRLKIPVAIGVNLGAAREYDLEHFLFDAGIEFTIKARFGLVGYDLTDYHRRLKGGLTYEFKPAFLTLEVEDSTFYPRWVPNIIVGLAHTFGIWSMKAAVGYHRRHAALAAEIDYKHTLRLALLSEETFQVQLGFGLNPGRAARHTDTVYVVKRVPVMTPPKNGTPFEPPSATVLVDSAYCDVHYRKGIGHYLNNRLAEAIREWTLVILECPDYKEVTRYLDNAREKQKLLKDQ